MADLKELGIDADVATECIEFIKGIRQLRTLLAWSLAKSVGTTRSR